MPERILIAEDQPELLEFICDALQESVPEIVRVSDGWSAWQQIEMREFALVVADLNMPWLSGIGLLEECRKSARSVPFVLMSGLAETDVLAKALNLGATRFLAKPFSVKQLLDVVNEALAQQRLKSEQKRFQARLQNQVARLRQQCIDEIFEREQMFMATLRALAAAIDARDAYTCRHSAAVADYACQLGLALGLSDAELRDLTVAGQMHDIGKIGVPESILNKPGTLTADEMRIMRTHPVQGAKILASLPNFGSVMAVVRSHHERYDGGGYPDGLRGDAIPLHARIMAVCDSWDAMRTDRPYRKGMSPDRAASILRTESGKQFDPQIVEAFLEHLPTERTTVLAENTA